MSVEQLIEEKEKEIDEKYLEYCISMNQETKETPVMISFEVFKAGYLANETPSGNQYTGYLKENNATWAKIKPDEPIFILRGQDITAPGTVLHWIAINSETVEESKIKEAFQTVLAMRRYDSRRDPT